MKETPWRMRACERHESIERTDQNAIPKMSKEPNQKR
jgi:hypothetical protein